MKHLIRALPAFALALNCLAAHAEIVGLSPFAAAPWGQQSDANAGPAYQQTFAAPTGFVLESIRWWGYHGIDSLGPSEDSFVVTLDGVVQMGALTIVDSGNGFAEYSLDVTDTALSASTLGVINDSFDVEWFWQSAPAVGNPDAPHADAVAFQLLGRIDSGSHNVPEPAPWALLLGAVGAATARRCGLVAGR